MEKPDRLSRTGPSTRPIVGNEHLIPRLNAHLKFTEWARQYGGIYTLKRFTNTTVIVSDPGLVKELLGRRSSLYSHRPAFQVGRLITRGDHLLLMQYGDEWRRLRKMIHQFFAEQQCDKWHVRLQNAEAAQLVHDFLVAPEDHMLHPKRYSNSITNSLGSPVFGIRTKTVQDDYMTRLFSLMEEWSEMLEVGATPPIDSFPLLKLIPERLFGRWRSRAVRVGELMTGLYSEVLDQVQHRRARGVSRGSFMDQVLDQNEKAGLTPRQLQFLGGVLMEGGSDTSASLIIAMIRAMIDFPEVLKRAHEEIDAVVGEDRSPTWEDFPRLSYINMIVKESHRWRPVTPLGISHAAAKDDWVNGHFIPQGSTVVLNVWAMHHDKQRWEKPSDFAPERYAQHPKLAPHYASGGGDADDGPGRDHFGYGAGRRVCPGIHLAERNLFLAAAKLLWAFDFGEGAGGARGESGGGFLQCVADYECVVTPRSGARAETIRREFREAGLVFSEYD
ncbi:cytochrome P450 2D18 [Colletotrichum plurivorum]|uniref:Cytochrome P450 2D18 n=1 Tax=Colletotrichum plurivorum TaxID=2175906 RepID=A0A8H6N886_9PEZI|nr:cytochrome P450 2D18 [Colletotrichum plurivorum]